MILIIDNYDSFTWNLYDYLSQLGKKVEVRRNDAISIPEISALQAEAIVLSPGPETPNEAGITLSVIEAFHQRIPILGVCLGYQAIGMYFGAKLVRSISPMHGKTSYIHHQQKDLFTGLNNPMEVMRYHSLNISHIPEDLEILASTDLQEPMAIKHKLWPVYGVQFHPESIGTRQGLPLLSNWLHLLQKV